MRNGIFKYSVSLLIFICTCTLGITHLQADLFTYVDESGKTMTIEATLYGSGKHRG